MFKTVLEELLKFLENLRTARKLRISRKRWKIRTSPLLANLRNDFGGLFYNLEDTLQINSILNDEKIKKLSKKDIGIINTFFKKEEELLQFFDNFFCYDLHIYIKYEISKTMNQ